jgi:hypothetical protein
MKRYEFFFVRCTNCILFLPITSFIEDIHLGSVVSIDIDGIDHPKWNIILDMTEDQCLVASVFINSEINFKHINTQELIDLQYAINAENHITSNGLRVEITVFYSLKH